MKQDSISRLSVSNIFLESLSFTWRNLGAILRQTWLLAIIGCAMFYFLFNEYMAELESYLAAPTEAHASIVLGLASASVLMLLFVYTLALGAVVDLALGHQRQRGLFSIRIGHQEGRLYAASLRFLLLMIVLAAAAYLLVLGIKTARLGYIVEYAAEFGIAAILIAVALRLGFLLPAVAMAETRGVIIRKSWKLADGIFLKLLLFTIVVVLPGLLMELLGELVARAMRPYPALYANGALRDNIIAFRHVAPVFSMLFCLPVMLTTLLYAIASTTIYRALVGTSLLVD
jgi:hypothetical protein